MRDTQSIFRKLESREYQVSVAQLRPESLLEHAEQTYEFNALLEVDPRTILIRAMDLASLDYDHDYAHPYDATIAVYLHAIRKIIAQPSTAFYFAR